MNWQFLHAFGKIQHETRWNCQENLHSWRKWIQQEEVAEIQAEIRLEKRSVLMLLAFFDKNSSAYNHHYLRSFSWGLKRSPSATHYWKWYVNYNSKISHQQGKEKKNLGNDHEEYYSPFSTRIDKKMYIASYVLSVIIPSVSYINTKKFHLLKKTSRYHLSMQRILLGGLYICPATPSQRRNQHATTINF